MTISPRISSSKFKFEFKFRLAYKIILLFILLFVSAISALQYYKQQLLQKEKEYVKILNELRLEKEITSALLMAIPKIQERFEYGDIENHFGRGEINCPDELSLPPALDDIYFRCNPNYLQCFFSGNAGNKNPVVIFNSSSGQTLTIAPLAIYPAKSSYSSAPRFYTILSKSNSSERPIPNYAIKMTLAVKEYPQYTMEILLEDSCHSTYLPNSIYASPNTSKGAWFWDNYQRHIFVDKFMASYRDIVEWIEYGNGDNTIAIPSSREFWSFPATSLTPKQMHAYCAFRGKQLLEAHIYDAATYYYALSEQAKQRPSEIDKELAYTHAKELLQNPYPWCENKIDSFVFKLQQDLERLKRMHPQKRFGILNNLRSLHPDTIIDRYLSLDNCQNLFARECAEYYYFPVYSSNGTSWSGLYQILGGFPEYFRNPILSKENLKISSFYLSINSPWQALGKRAYWDEKGLLPSNIHLYSSKNREEELEFITDFFNKNTNPLAGLHFIDHNKRDGEKATDGPLTIKVGFRCMEFTY
ncbi:MAG: hypothetical protein HQK52_13300 [Oligoflexia bacterium]|nr:hypothetical protein [Oligoflexia bacterium]